MNTINMHNLHEFSAQEVFTLLKDHMLNQNEKSFDVDSGNIKTCAYRGANGLKCPAGVLIPDDEFNGNMEGATWEQLAAEDGVSTAHKHLIMQIQRVHDDIPVEFWESELLEVAVDFELNM